VRNYELAFIIEPNVSGEAVSEMIDKVSQFVQMASGTVEKRDVWGRKSLAYPIKNYREGTYVLLNAKLEPSLLGNLENNLKLTEEIIRYMLVKADS